MKRLIVLLNALFIVFTAVMCFIYKNNYQLWLKALTASGFVAIGVVNLIHALLLKKTKGFPFLALFCYFLCFLFFSFLFFLSFISFFFFFFFFSISLFLFYFFWGCLCIPFDVISGFHQRLASIQVTPFWVFATRTNIQAYCSKSANTKTSPVLLSRLHTVISNLGELSSMIYML